MYQTPKILVYVAQSATHTSSFKHYFLQNKQPLPLPPFLSFLSLLLLIYFLQNGRAAKKKKLL
jgi:hypothetical protein